MKEHKIEKKFIYEGLGFPVILHDVPMIRLRDEWALDINMNHFQRAVLLALAYHPFDLTGDHIRYIRSWLRLNYEKFATLFGVTHPAVLKWEKSKGRLVKISVLAQREIRLHVIDKILKNNCVYPYSDYFYFLDRSIAFLLPDFILVSRRGVELSSEEDLFRINS